MKADVTKSTLRRARLSGSTFCLFVQNDKKEREGFEHQKGADDDGERRGSFNGYKRTTSIRANTAATKGMGCGSAVLKGILQNI
jgi:hypothetical protein